MVLTSFPAFPPGPWPGISVLLLSQQGVPEDIQEALGQSISQAPFVKALAAAERYVVVRNRSAAAVLGAFAHKVGAVGVSRSTYSSSSVSGMEDLYTRAWCLVEYIYASWLAWYRGRRLLQSILRRGEMPQKAECPRCVKLQNSKTTEAKKIGFYKDKVLVTGPNEFSASLLQQALD